MRKRLFQIEWFCIYQQCLCSRCGQFLVLYFSSDLLAPSCSIVRWHKSSSRWPEVAGTIKTQRTGYLAPVTQPQYSHPMSRTSIRHFRRSAQSLLHSIRTPLYCPAVFTMTENRSSRNLFLQSISLITQVDLHGSWMTFLLSQLQFHLNSWVCDSARNTEYQRSGGCILAQLLNIVNPHIFHNSCYVSAMSVMLGFKGLYILTPTAHLFPGWELDRVLQSSYSLFLLFNQRNICGHHGIWFLWYITHCRFIWPSIQPAWSLKYH